MLYLGGPLLRHSRSGDQIAGVGVNSEQSVNVYVGLGSNSPDAESMLDMARRRIAALPKLRLNAVSPVYSTEPQGFADQPWFLNQVVEIAAKPSWRPQILLASLLKLETEMGRVRSPDPAMRYGPRVIDVDLLLYGEERHADPCCMLPHPRLTQRAFVLVPLLDIAPQISIDNLPAASWLARLAYRLEGRRIFQ